MFLFSVSTFIVALTAFLQTTEIVSFGFIKPNLVLILLVVLSSIYKDWSRRFILVLIGSIILKFSQVFELVDLIVIATFLLSIATLDYLPWHKFFNVLLAVTLGTVVLNTIVFIPIIFVFEMFTNIILTAAIFFIAQIIYEEEIRSQENRF